MRWILSIVGVIFVLAGIVWILQGVNVLLGSMMSGQPLYAVLGFVMAVLGVVMLVFANRRRQPN